MQNLKVRTRARFLCFRCSVTLPSYVFLNPCKPPRFPPRVLTRVHPFQSIQINPLTFCALRPSPNPHPPSQTSMSVPPLPLTPSMPSAPSAPMCPDRSIHTPSDLTVLARRGFRHARRVRRAARAAGRRAHRHFVAVADVGIADRIFGIVGLQHGYKDAGTRVREGLRLFGLSGVALYPVLCIVCDCNCIRLSCIALYGSGLQLAPACQLYLHCVLYHFAGLVFVVHTHTHAGPLGRQLASRLVLLFLLCIRRLSLWRRSTSARRHS